MRTVRKICLDIFQWSFSSPSPPSFSLVIVYQHHRSKKRIIKVRGEIEIPGHIDWDLIRARGLPTEEDYHQDLPIIPRENFKFDVILGQGFFGEVSSARCNGLLKSFFLPLKETFKLVQAHVWLWLRVLYKCFFSLCVFHGKLKAITLLFLMTISTARNVMLHRDASKRHLTVKLHF